MKQDILNLFLDTAIERHHIYLKKEKEELKPWTEDPVFQQFFFCNVFRQYDKCTKWIIKNVLPLNRWDLIILYRFISTYSTFKEIEELGFLEDLEMIKLFLQRKYLSEEKIFSSCFIRNPRIPGGWTQTWKVPFILIESLEKFFFVPSSFNSLKDMVDYLSKFPGVGGFMGYEYACDFEYTHYFNPQDKYTWANKGPGAQRGLSWVIWGNPNHKFSIADWNKLIRELFVEMKKRFNEVFPEEDLTMREVEHWLCEFQKYTKYKLMLLNKHNNDYKVKHRKYNGLI